jgi:hypothetical protein
MTTETRINVVTAVGVLDTQLRRKQEQTITQQWNGLQGRTDQIALQLSSPFGVPFRLMVELAGPVAGRELLAEVPAGTLLAITGELEWQMTIDPRYALDATERGRRASEIRFRAHTIRLATASDEQGCDAWIVGTVLTPARILRHPDKPIRIVATTVQIQHERRRAQSRAQIAERANVAVVVPLDHPMAPNLYRPGNQVLIEGMLERVQVTLSGSDVERAVAAVDTQWATEQARLAEQSPALRAATQTYRKQRQRLLEATRTRLVAGYVELLAGMPATIEEALTIRRERQRERRLAQRARETARAATPQPQNRSAETPGLDTLPAPEANSAEDDSQAGLTRAVRPRRRVEIAQAPDPEVAAATEE